MVGLSLFFVFFIILALIGTNASMNEKINQTEFFFIKKQIIGLEKAVHAIGEQTASIDTNIQNLTSIIHTDLTELISIERENRDLSTLQLFGVPLTVGIPFMILIISRYLDKKGILTRSSDALIQEINDNREALEGKKSYQIISYKTTDPRTNQKFQVKYVNAFLDFEAYESVISSGELSHFKVKTQYYVTYIYTRIKNHNEMINYTNEFEDRYFIGAEDKEKRKRWEKEVEKYEISLSKWEQEILENIPLAIKELEREKKRKNV